MKKIFLILALAAAAATTSCAGGAKGLKSEADSVAYYAGANLAAYVRQIDSTMNLNLMLAGLKDGLANKEAADAHTSFAFLQEYMTVRLPAQNLAKSREFLAGIESKKGVQKTASGLLYQIQDPGDEEVKAMVDYDEVRVVYHGTLPDGQVFDSSRERGDTVSFPLNQVIPGWTEGMKLVGKGGKIKLWVPSELAYGTNDGRGPIGPNQAIVFEVELIDVIPYVEPRQ